MAGNELFRDCRCQATAVQHFVPAQVDPSSNGFANSEQNCLPQHASGADGELHFQASFKHDVLEEYSFNFIVQAARDLAKQVGKVARREDSPVFEKAIDPVAVLCDTGPCLVASMLACSLEQVPFVLFDPQWPAARMQSSYVHANCRAIIVDKSLNLSANSWFESLESAGIITVHIQGGNSGCAQVNGVNTWGTKSDRGMQCCCHVRGSLMRDSNKGLLHHIAFTSGSTGKPKAVMCTRHQFSSFIQAWNAALQRAHNSGTCCILLASAPSFDPCIGEVFSSLSSASILVTAPFKVLQCYPDRIMKQVQIDQCLCTPSFLRLLASNFPDPSNHTLISCEKTFLLPRLLIVGGEQLLLPIASYFIHQHVDILVTYGTTESTVYQTLGPFIPENNQCVGKPLASCNLLIQNPAENGTGEVIIYGPQVSDGYLGDHENFSNSQGRFIQLALPVSGAHADVANCESIRSERTGDIGRIDHTGSLILLGRSDSQVKIRGQRLDLNSVESVMCSNSSWIQQCKVSIIQPRGSDDARLAAAIELSTRGLSALHDACTALGEKHKKDVDLIYSSNLLFRMSGPLLGALLYWAKQHLTLAETPAIVFVMRSLPQSHSGKYLFPSTPEGGWQSVPEPLVAAKAKSTAASLNPRQALVHSLTCAVLGIHSADSLGADEPLVRMGLDSLTAFRLAKQLRDKLHLKPDDSGKNEALTRSVVDEHCTVRSIANTLPSPEPDADDDVRQAYAGVERPDQPDSASMARFKSPDSSSADAGEQPGSEILADSVTGECLLQYGCCIGSVNLCELLLENGYPVEGNARPSGSQHSTTILSFSQSSKKQQKRLSKSAITPLHTAVANGHADIVRVLLKYSAKMNSMTRWGVLPLHLAAAKSSECLEAMIEAGAPLRVRDNNSQTPVHHAARAGNTDSITRLAKYLQRAGEDSYRDIDAGDRWRRSPLHWACINGHAHTVEVLLSLGASTTMAVTQRTANKTRTTARIEPPLHLACRCGHFDCVKLMLKLHSSLASESVHGSCNPNSSRSSVTDNGLFNFFATLQPSQIPTSQERFRHAHPTTEVDSEGGTALHAAAQGVPNDHETLLQSSERRAIVALLVLLGWDAGAQDSFGCCPGDLAASQNRMEIVTFLSSAGHRCDAEKANYERLGGWQSQAADARHKKRKLMKLQKTNE